MRQRILVAVDGSENSLKAVAHVGDILVLGSVASKLVHHVRGSAVWFVE